MPLARRAVHGPEGRLARARSVLLAGAGGPLGSAVLEQLLASGAFEEVRVVVDAPIAPAMRGFGSLPLAQLERNEPLHADTALIVFDRERDANGREAAFHRPMPERLPSLAHALHARGLRRLIVVLPHSPALLPAALKVGLASLDEQAVAAIGFDQFVIVRSAQKPAARRAATWPQRVADAMLSQLHWMIPQREQPVRASKVAAFVAELAKQLAHSAPGARVVPPELVWHAGQVSDPRQLVVHWLDAGHVPESPVPVQRW
jgi:hypothetical protein